MDSAFGTERGQPCPRDDVPPTDNVTDQKSESPVFMRVVTMLRSFTPVSHPLPPPPLSPVRLGPLSATSIPVPGSRFKVQGSPVLNLFTPFYTFLWLLFSAPVPTSGEGHWPPIRGMTGRDSPSPRGEGWGEGEWGFLSTFDFVALVGDCSPSNSQRVPTASGTQSQ